MTASIPATACILVLDDHPVSRQQLGPIHEYEAYEVLTAADGEEALERAPASPPDLIVLDVVMLGMGMLNA
jgi:two-component system response regulator MprA